MKNKKKKKKSNGVYKMQPEKEFPLFEDKCWYRAKFEEHEENEGKFGPIVFLKFKVLSGEMEDGSEAKGQNAMAMVPAELTPTSKFYEFVEVFNGEELDVDDEIDIKAFYGTKCEIFVESHAKKKRENGKPYQNVTAVRIPKKKKKKSKKKSKK